MRQQQRGRLSPNLMLILWLVAAPTAVVMGASIGEGEEGAKGQAAESEKIVRHLVCLPVRPNQHTRAGENEALIASQSGKLRSNSFKIVHRKTIFPVVPSYHSILISERGKFYTTRFGRSDPSLTRQVILGFSISRPSGCL